MPKNLNLSQYIRYILTFGDLVILNGLFLLCTHFFSSVTLGAEFLESFKGNVILLNMAYWLCCFSRGIVVMDRIVRVERIVQHACLNVSLHSAVFIASSILMEIGTHSFYFYTTFYTLYLLLLLTFRLGFRTFVEGYRSKGGNSRTAVMVGVNKQLMNLHRSLVKNAAVGIRMIGYFDDEECADFLGELPYLGKKEEAIAFLDDRKANQVYCGLDQRQAEFAHTLTVCCERNMLEFFLVPDVFGHVKRKMVCRYYGNIALFVLREEPLSNPFNRFLKRTFDVLFSGVFLCTIFPFVYVIMGIGIKLSSPGPIFFKQKRTGKNDEEFYCYKFRSMRLNADCDRVQATEHDPRKTKIGEFMRRTSIDELPQFINVFLGQMSVVGPRPHMLKHTEQYSRLISNYMVRHLVKPGVTGWAQVTGYRGETKELWQMEGRVERDVWYLEHWSFLLDLHIIYLTIRNAIKGEKEAY